MFLIKPDTYSAFEDEAALIQACKEWGLLSEKAAKSKAFYYKGSGLNVSCTIVGRVDSVTAVISFDNGQLHCIHPSYLKEMQASSYGQRSAAADETAEAADKQNADPQPSEQAPQQQQAQQQQAPLAEAQASVAVEEKPPAAAKPKKAKAAKLELPESKVKMRATVQEFTSVPNHFTEEEDAVVIYEAVSIEDPEIEVGAAWSSYSATLEKLELKEGDMLTFEAKIVAKKLTKHPVAYKINNPQKIQKLQP